MTTFWTNFKNQWRDSANLILGLWLFFSPWILQFRELDYAVWNAWALGVVIAIAAFAALTQFHEWEEWVSLLFGAWLVIAPWVLGFTASAFATWNHVVVGLLVAGMASWSIYQARHTQTPTQTA